MEFGRALDDFIAVFSPEAAARRRSWRDAYSAYDAASSTRKDLPFASDGKAEQINTGSRHTIRARVRDLERNSEVVSGMLHALENNVIGSKINMQAASNDDDFNQRIEELFGDWMHSENCDITEAQNLTEITKMCLRRWLIDGGVLAVYCYDQSEYGLKLQIREVDDLVAESNPGLANGNLISNGIEMNKYGKPIYYLLNKYNPDGYSTDLTPEKVEAARVDFLWRKERASQFREISPLAKSVVRINDLDDYTNAVAFQQKTMACVSAFVESDNYSTQAGRPVNTNDGRRLKDLHAGSITYLRPGEKIKPFIPNGQATEMENYVVTELRMIAAAQGLSLESATRNVERVNYSSARQNMLADQQTYKSLREFMIEHFLRKLYKRFVKQCWLKGLLNDTSFNPNDKTYYEAKWLTEGLPWIDPLKEANANAVQLANGGMSFQRYCADNGADWRERLEEMAEVQKYADELGVKLNYIATNEAIIQPMDEGGDGDGNGENQESGS